MKSFCILVASIGFVLWCPSYCWGHWENVHVAVSGQAVQSSIGLNSFIVEYFGTGNPANPQLPLVLKNNIQYTHTPNTWVKIGSSDEDGGINGSIGVDARVRHHFYRSDNGGGLTDGADGFAKNSFEWATTQGDYSWGNSRTYEFLALTSSTKIARDENLAKLLYSIGHTLHLNQDLTQPEHSRNDQHRQQEQKAIENYGLTYLKQAKASLAIETMFPKSTRTRDSWRNAGFNKLKDFWDRDKYLGTKAGGSGALVADVLGGVNQLGLAEFVNGNFVGRDASYREFHKASDDQHYFEYPSLESSTTFASKVRKKFGASLQNVTFRDGFVGTKAYVDKLSDGIIIKPHSLVTHNGIKFKAGLASKIEVATTADDEKVLNAYYSALVPKAIEYSTGILDYFFRGQIDYSIVSYSPSEWVITVKNISGESFKGGKFVLLTEDNTSGNRTELDNITLGAGEILADGETREFPAITAAPIANTKYFIVYQGTIGLTGTSASDPVDEGKAIAVKQICCVPESGNAVPNPLEIPVNVDLGTATIIKDPVSFGNFGAGRYQIEYVSGAIHLRSPNEGSTYMYFTRFCYNPDFLCQLHIYVELDSDDSFGSLVGTQSEMLSVVESVTLALNSPSELRTDGGNLGLKLEDTFSLPGEFTFAPPGATYRLRRTAMPYAQPSSVRIKDWETTVKPLLTMSCEYYPVSNENEWDGTFPDEYGDWQYPFYNNLDETSLNGKNISGYVAYESGTWVLSLYSGNSSFWRGEKVVGNDATGRYVQDVDDDPDCPTNLKCITIESY